MAQQHQRDRRVLLAGPGPKPVDVVHELGPPLLADLAELVRGPRCRPVPAVVLSVDHHASRGQRLGQVGVPEGVLSDAVGDLDDGTRGAVGIPAVCRHGQAATGEVDAGWAV